ncbi:NAD(P)-binding protein [Hypoxylon sp. EC38]|nr:NAD(P)-binding protein [Hypoxylon sp. EC38]
MPTLPVLWALWQQFFPQAPTFTEKDVSPGSQVGKVFVITGANSGIGLALVKLLYPIGATIYLAGRSPPKLQAAIAEVSSVLPSPTTPSKLKSLYLDLSDLTTVKSAAAYGLDILWNNAGSGHPPGSVTKQGIEAHVGAYCVAPLLFAQELLPMLRAAAQIATPGSVRIVWSGSTQIEMLAPHGGIDFARIEKPTTATLQDYGASKAGNWFLAFEGARRWGRFGIISVCQNPGNLHTGIYANKTWLFMAFLKTFAKYGAYTMPYSGFSPEVSESSNGAYIWPWGRIRPMSRPDVLNAALEGKATEFWEWCEKQWKQHV